jgi:Tfp pilus assembly protein PilV
MLISDQKGQSLIEVLVVGAVSAVMIVALAVIILSSLKNAQFAQNQTQATKLAQDAIDKIRILRDGNANMTLTPPNDSAVCFSKLWEINSNFDCSAQVGSYCYYRLTLPAAQTGKISLDEMTTEPAAKDTSIGNGFYRLIKINQTSNTEVRLVVQVGWTDSSGEHNSNLETILTKPNYDCI